MLDAAGVRWFQLDARTPLEEWADEIHRRMDFSQYHPPAGLRPRQPDGRLMMAD